MYSYSCNDCGVEFSRVRMKSSFDGLSRCTRCVKRKYKKTEKGKSADRRYHQSDAFKATLKRYQTSDKGREKHNAWHRSEDGRALARRKNIKRYWSDPEYWRQYALVKLYGEYELDNECYLCGSQETLTLDHLHPRSRGGGNKIENYGTLCRSCNAFKGNRLMTPGMAVLVGDY